MDFVVYYLSKIEIKGKVELKVVSQDKGEVEEDSHKKSKVKVENRISVSSDGSTGGGGGG